MAFRIHLRECENFLGGGVSYYRVSFRGVIYVELLTPDMHVYISFFPY